MSADLHLQKFQVLQHRLESSQFVYRLDIRTLLPIDLAATAIGKSPSTFRSDLCRRPDSLPRVVRRGGRVFVFVGDLISWLDGQYLALGANIPRRKRGRPSKAEQIVRLSPRRRLSGGATTEGG